MPPSKSASKTTRTSTRVETFRRIGFNTFDEKTPEQLSRSFLWDRASCLDKLFGSGMGSDAPLAPMTLENARQAEQTMKGLAEQRAIMVAEKAKRRARQQRANAMANNKLNAAMSIEEQGSEMPGGTNQRHTWCIFGHFHSFHTEASKWTGRVFPTKLEGSTSDTHLRFITWNAFFDLQRNGKNEWVPGDNSLLAEADDTLTRWGELIQILAEENADVIVLQEITPRFLALLL
jgi:hypothetical protein